MAYQMDGRRIDHGNGSDAVAASVALALGATRTARPPRTERAFACGAGGARGAVSRGAVASGAVARRSRPALSSSEADSGGAPAAAPCSARCESSSRARARLRSP